VGVAHTAVELGSKSRGEGTILLLGCTGRAGRLGFLLMIVYTVFPCYYDMQ
jgi:hypothetical protein